ncbi:MAG: hypothetical protein ACXW4U_03820, partial [Anaerolineales bacterium]
YSGVILFLTSIASLLCFYVDSRSGSSLKFGNMLRYGWLVIALTFAGFSFDEIGSIHERADLILSGASYSLGLGGWVGVLWPLMALIFTYYILFFYFYLARSRISQVMALIGGGLLISVPVQEFLESKMRLGEQKRGTLLGMLEEGSEVIGTTLILISFLEFAIMSSRLASAKGSVSPDLGNMIQIRFSDQFVKVTYSLVMVSAIASIAMAWFLVPHLGDLHHRGNPSVWHPSLALFVACVVALINFSLECKNKNRLHVYSFKWSWVLVGVVCLWFSVDFESGINTGIYTSIKFLSDLLIVSARAGEILLSITIVAMGLATFLAVAGIRVNRSSRWLFCLGVLSWAGVFAVGSWEIKEALKIVSPSLFLVSFVESMKYLYGPVPSKSTCSDLKYNPLRTSS